MKCLAVEVEKKYPETKIQLVISPVALGCRDARRTPAVDDLLTTVPPPARSAGAFVSSTGTLRSKESAQSGMSSGGCLERSQFEEHLSDGFVVLTTLQLRAHAMFSHEGLPVATDTLEYSWLIELLLGSVLARINPAHVCILKTTRYVLRFF